MTAPEKTAHDGRLLEVEYQDPNLNLALDHAIVKLHTGNDPDYLTVRFWRNPNCVVLGRGQATSEEVDLDFCRENHITVCRRVSGGGTVYQDQGNLNVSLFLPRETTTDLHGIHGACSELTDIIAESLRANCAQRIERVGTYNIFSEGGKVSGAASYITKTSLLHHATLLISADLKLLEGSLIHHRPPLKRGASRYSPTCNLSNLDAKKWKETFVALVSKRFCTEIRAGEISEEEATLAVELLASTYSRHSWIMG